MASPGQVSTWTVPVGSGITSRKRRKLLQHNTTRNLRPEEQQQQEEEKQEQEQEQELQDAIMNDDTFPFFELPRELRDLIYGFALSYDGVQDCINNYNFIFPQPFSVVNNHRQMINYLATPSILLTNRQIHQEALSILKKKELHISCPIFAIGSRDWNNGHQFLDALIGRHTLRNLNHVRLTLEIWYLDWCRHVSEQNDYEEDYYLTDNWTDEHRESILFAGEHWFRFLLSLELDVEWKTLTVELKRCTLGDDGEKNEKVETFHLPTNLKERRELRVRLGLCIPVRRYEGVTHYLEQFRGNTA